MCTILNDASKQRMKAWVWVVIMRHCEGWMDGRINKMRLQLSVCNLQGQARVWFPVVWKPSWLNVVPCYTTACVTVGAMGSPKPLEHTYVWSCISLLNLSHLPDRYIISLAGYMCNSISFVMENICISDIQDMPKLVKSNYGNVGFWPKKTNHTRIGKQDLASDHYWY